MAAGTLALYHLGTAHTVPISTVMEPPSVKCVVCPSIKSFMSMNFVTTEPWLIVTVLCLYGAEVVCHRTSLLVLLFILVSMQSCATACAHTWLGF